MMAELTPPLHTPKANPKVIFVVNLSPICFPAASRAFMPTLSALSLTLALAGAAHAQATLPTLPPAPAPAPPTSTATLDPAALAAVADPNALAINIDGRTIVSDPPPILRNGRTFVPLRGVLENLGAQVDYVASDRRVDINRAGQKVQLFLGTTRAISAGQEVEVEKPLVIDGRTFVPLRAVSELFGLKVAWLPLTRTVSINTGAPVAAPNNRRVELKAAGPFGVTIDFTQHPVEAIPSLLDSARAAGVGLIKFRFDWGTLQPAKDGPFEWAYFDTVLREARARGLRVTGILGDTAPWASVSSSTFGSDQRQSPPRPDAYDAWANYVRRTVGRYGNDVLAWQVWENPNSANFRSVDKNYRKLARLAIDTARAVDPNLIIYVADPGGVDLDTIRGYNTNGLTGVSDGIVVYPNSLYQALAPAPAEAFLRPYARVTTALTLPDSRKRDYWVGGLSRPVALPFPGAQPNADGKRALEIFTPVGQADYLVKSMTLALAAGSDKVFYDQLRDVPDARMNATLQSNPPMVAAADPAAVADNNMGPVTGAPGALATATTARVSAPREGVVQDNGLQRADGTPRPAFGALRNLTANLKDKPYRGNLQFDSKLVALLFDNGQSGVLVAWSPDGEATLALNSSGAIVNLPGGQFVATRPDSLVTDSLGNVVSPPDGAIKLGARPIIITNVGSETAQRALMHPPEAGLRLQNPSPFEGAQTVGTELSPDGAEQGIYWRRYTNFGSVADAFVNRDGRQGLTTQPQRDIFDLKSQKPFVYLDVADDFLYDAPGAPVTLQVEVYAAPLSNPNAALGFRVEYNSSSGNKSVPWQPLVPGSGWQTFLIPLPDAQFSNAGGYDMLFNVGASATGVTFGKVALTRGLVTTPFEVPAPVAPVVDAPADATGTPDVVAPVAGE